MTSENDVFFACRKDKLIGRSRYVFVYLLLMKSKDFVSILMTSVLCLFVCGCVCLFVCLFVGTITRERKKLPMSNYTT